MAEYIDREAVFHAMKMDVRPPFAVVRDFPAADVAPVVRCKDCIWRGREECAMFYRCECGEQHTWETDDDFCSYGERKEPDNEQSNRNQ